MLLAVIVIIVAASLLVLAFNGSAIFPPSKGSSASLAPTATHSTVNTIPNPTPTPSPVPIMGKVILSPNNQTVTSYTGQYDTGFNITISHYENNTLKFPCYVGIVSSESPNGNGESLSFQPTYYGTYNFTVIGSYALKGQTVSYYAIVKDSNTVLIISNTVTVKYE